jgi:hypothetical protein
MESRFSRIWSDSADSRFNWITQIKDSQTIPLSQIFPQIKTSKWVSHSTALKLRTHWVQPNSNYELIDYQWVRMHSKFCTQLRLHSNCELIDYQWVRMHSKFCTQLRLHSNLELIEYNRTQIANSLIISEFVCTQSFALNCGCTQTTNSLIISEFGCTQSFALNHSQKMN